MSRSEVPTMTDDPNVVVSLCADEQIALVNKLRAQYNVPVIGTGDYNRNQDHEHYTRMLADAGLYDTMKTLLAASDGRLVNNLAGTGTIGYSRSSTNKNYIDHIAVSNGYETLRYQTIVGNLSYWASDHSPHIADIKI